METKGYLVAGPGGVKWSIWDHGDELTVCSGPELLSPVVASIEPAIAKRLDFGARWSQIVSAASSIHVAMLAGWDAPIFHKLWRCR